MTIARITIGRGNSRRTTYVPNSFDAKAYGRAVEMIAEDVKTIACRPALLSTIGLNVL